MHDYAAPRKPTPPSILRPRKTNLRIVLLTLVACDIAANLLLPHFAVISACGRTRILKIFSFAQCAYEMACVLYVLYIIWNDTLYGGTRQRGGIGRGIDWQWRIPWLWKAGHVVEHDCESRGLGSLEMPSQSALDKGYLRRNLTPTFAADGGCDIL